MQCLDGRTIVRGVLRRDAYQHEQQNNDGVGFDTSHVAVVPFRNGCVFLDQFGEVESEGWVWFRMLDCPAIIIAHNQVNIKNENIRYAAFIPHLQ